MDLIIGNIDFIQKMLNDVKQTEKDMKIKYNNLLNIIIINN